jgi:hypothetical protein
MTNQKDVYVNEIRGHGGNTHIHHGFYRFLELFTIHHFDTLR